MEKKETVITEPAAVAAPYQRSARPFVHLHVHSCYSLMDSTIKINDLVRTARDMDMPAVALTDHGQMFGVLEFYKAALKAGVKPILGVEAYVAAAGRRSRVTPDLQHHLVLLAENMEGYRNLCRLVSLASIEGFYYKPRVDKELLAAHSQNLIALSGCLQGEVPWKLLNRGQAEAARAAEEYAAMFPGRFYLELHSNGLPEQAEANAGLMEIGRTLGLPLAAANDCHYLLKEHHDLHEVLLCLQTMNILEDGKRLRFNANEYHFKSPSEMAEAFRETPEALANTLTIAERCQVELPLPRRAAASLPAEKFPGRSEAEDLRTLARDGLEKRLAAKAGLTEAEKTAYQGRLEKELAAIIEMGWPGYFLIVADYVNWARNKGIPVGPGRGSAPGSLVNYALSITEVDPFRFDLLFERFLDPERDSSLNFRLDIDVDFCALRHGEVMAYVTEKYGRERAARIITFRRLKARQVIRDVARVLGWTLDEAEALVKLVPAGLDEDGGWLREEDGWALEATLDRALADDPRLALAAEADPRTAELLKYARHLENLPCGYDTHAAGVVISDRPLTEHLPLCRIVGMASSENPRILTQFEARWVEDLGLVKFDFLGLKTLTVIDYCLELLNKKGAEADFQGQDFKDGPTWALLARGDTEGVFMEIPGLREYLARLKPDGLEDLMALASLYRPGLFQSGLAERFIDIRRGFWPVVYDLPQMEPILKETGGLIVYQEQIMRLAQVLAGFSLGQADLLRRALSKKDPREMARWKARFLAGAREGGIGEKKADQIFEFMDHSAGYTYNKSHSAACAVLTYRTAWLKAHHPLEFMAALMTSEQSHPDKMARLVREGRAAGLRILPPDVNESGARSTVAGGAIRLGLKAIKGLGKAAIESIIEARENGGPFTSLYDFCERVDTRKVNRRVLESLIMCGAFDLSGGADRAVMFQAIDLALETGARRQRDLRDGQANIFGLLAAADQPSEATRPASLIWPHYEYKYGHKFPLEPWSGSVRLEKEKKVLGFSITEHPLDRFEAELRLLNTIPIRNVLDRPDREEVRLAGVAAGLKIEKDKRGQDYGFLTLEDYTGSIEVLVLAGALEKAKTCLTGEGEDQVMLVTGVAETGVAAESRRKGIGGGVRVIASEILPLAVFMSSYVVTEPAAVAALKQIYQTNGPGQLDWDFSIPGQVTARDGRLKARDGALTSLDLFLTGLQGVLKLHGLADLTVLEAVGNGFSGIDFENLPGLKELSLNKNKIKDLGLLAGLTGLTDLELRNNKISDLGPLAGLTGLTKLDLGGNEGLSDLSPLAGLTALTELYLGGKQISDLGPLAGLTGLTLLGLGGNEGLSDLGPLAGLAALTELNLGGNQISDLGPLAGLTALKVLDIQKNKVSDLSPLAGLENLEILRYDHNPLPSREVVAWLRLAAERGKAEARFQLGRAYESGEGVAKDTAEAARWYGLAAEHGHSQARYFLDRLRRLTAKPYTFSGGEI